MSATVRRSRASMSSVHVLGAPAEPPRQRLRQRRLARRHETDEIDLVRLQEAASLGERFERREELGVGDGDRIGAADDRRRLGAQSRNGKRHGEPVVAGRVGLAAPSRRAPRR